MIRFRTDAPHEAPVTPLADFLGRTNATAVRLEPADDARALLPHLGRLALIEVAFPKYRDGRGYSAGRILREAGYAGELRAQGDVLVDQLPLMRRCGYDSFAPDVPLDDAALTRALDRYPEVYQKAADGRLPSGHCVMGEPARRIDLIDTSPAFTTADVAALNARYDSVSTDAMLRDLLTGDLAGRIALVSSFGAESAVLLHLVSGIDRGVPLIFTNTQKMFGETLAYRDTLAEQLGFTDLRVYRPDPASLAARDATGLRWSYDPDGCCEIRKVEPLARALTGFAAWISGRKGFQASTRAALPRFELDETDGHGRLKINPLASWTKPDLDGYFATHKLPLHPLVEQDYLSIGCAPCTSKVRPGEDPRAGRWRGWDKMECGIHVSEIKPGDEPAF